MNKILIANRGEIALRIMRTCKEMGIRTVAVFSEADRSAPFVRYADEALFIGAAPSSQSYLNGTRIIAAAKVAGADGIHPGYGFLSENAEFAQQVVDAGLVFIGPSAQAMRLMGDKLSAKATAKNYNVPLVPGSDGAITSLEEGKSIALRIGLPLLIKASAGGGGKGMRLVTAMEDFESQMQLAVSEATAAFGNGAVFIEKFVENPRHIEIQLLGDNFGNYLFLHERECSIQRRHQKVIEEAPSSLLTNELRNKMGECAVALGKACGYTGAGTVEFLVDKNLNFYFLEMNTRLQVEHPVTEMITGIDLVKEQILIARGNRLSINQEEVKLNGHSIEIRVYAEDPKNQFLPDIGKLTAYSIPKGPGVRLDDGFEEGMQIPIYYDPMIAKLITFGANRNEAIARMLRAIDEYTITGVATTLEFCKFVLQHESFVSGNFDTNFVGQHFLPGKLMIEEASEAQVAGIFISTLLHSHSNQHSAMSRSLGSEESTKSNSRWKSNRLK